MTKIKAILAGLAAILTPAIVLAEGGEAAVGAANPMIPIAIAIGIGLAAVAGTWSQARTASTALEGIARNPNAADKLFTPMILGLAFIESLVLFTWVLMLLMQLKM